MMLKSSPLLLSTLLLLATQVDGFVIAPVSPRNSLQLSLFGLGGRRPQKKPSAAPEASFTAETAANVEAAKEPEAPSIPKNVYPKITTVGKLQDFLKFQARDDRLCVVKFHAAWCKSCQKFDVKYRKLAHQEGDVYDAKTRKLVKRGKVRFAQIEFGMNGKLCRNMGIKKLPTIHIYKGKLGKLEDFPCGPAKFPILQEKLQHLKSCSDEQLALEQTLGEGTAMADAIVTKLQKNQHSADNNNNNNKAAAVNNKTSWEKGDAMPTP